MFNSVLKLKLKWQQQRTKLGPRYRQLKFLYEVANQIE